MKTIVVALAAFLVVASSCSRSGEARKPRETRLTVDPSEESFYLVHDGKKRTGVMHVPAGYDGSIPCSLVFALHGKGGTGARFRELGFDEYADRYNFIMVYPDAIAGIWEIYPGITGANDDVAFFRKMLKGFSKKYRIDPARVYVTGHSMGGYMTYRLAHDMPGTFSAMAPVAGLSVVFGNPEARGPISLLHLHAADDWTVRVGAQTDTDVSSARDSVLEWKMANGIDTAYRETAIEGGGIEKTWSGKDGVEVTYRLYARGGHAWPRDATRTIADFLYDHPPRDNGVSFRGADRPLLRTSTDVVAIEALVERPELAERVELVRRGAVVGTRTAPPYLFDYRPEMNTSENLYARVRRKGSAVSSDVFRIVTTPENLARDASAASGERERGLPPANAIDGDLATRWGSGFSDDQYLQIDLGEERLVRGVSLFWERAHAVSYAIEVSLDGVAWKRVHERDGGKGGNEFVQFAPTRARFVRLTCVKRSTPYGYSLWEMMVH